MGRKGVDLTKKIEAIKKYKRGEASLSSILRDYCVDIASLRQNRLKRPGKNPALIYSQNILSYSFCLQAFTPTLDTFQKTLLAFQ